MNELSAEEERDLRAAFKRDEWAREWNSLPAAVARIVAERTRVAVERAEVAEAALRELVALKDGPRDADYERRKPLACEAARNVLTGGEGSGGAESRSGAGWPSGTSEGSEPGRSTTEGSESGSER